MKQLRFVPALFSTSLLLLMTGTIMGIDLESEGTRLVVEKADHFVLLAIVTGALLVFFFQLFRNFLVEFKWPVVPLNINYQGSIESLWQNPVIRKAISCCFLVALFLWPFFVSRSSIDLATLALIYVMLGLGLNIVVGLAGLLDLGYVGFYAIGAYSYALLNQYFGFGFWSCLAVGGAISAFAGLLLGFPVLRLRGDYLAIVTLGFGEIIRILLNNWTELTGGPNGISQIPKPTFFGIEFSRRSEEPGFIPFHEFAGIDYSSSHKIVFLYLLALALVLLSYFIINRLLKMPIGRAWEALREDEIACRSLGLNPTVIKLSAFTIGASFAGFAGSLGLNPTGHFLLLVRGL